MKRYLIAMAALALFVNPSCEGLKDPETQLRAFQISAETLALINKLREAERLAEEAEGGGSK
jgi:hypothetical protein